MQSAERRLGMAALAMCLALGLTLSLAARPARPQQATISPELAGQKAVMLKGLFSSTRLRRARESNPSEVGALEAEARARLDAGEAALAEGRAAAAIEHFDAGMRIVSKAVAFGAPAAQWDAQAASVAFVERRRHAESYLAMLEGSAELTDEERSRAASLRGRLGEADAEFSAGALADARETLDAAYGEIIGLVRDVGRGHTVVVSRVFETPEDEFDYELRRHDSYVLLVRIALAERGEDQPGLAAMAARLTAESGRLRANAEGQGASGDFVGAIETIEGATERLLAILRATGMIVME